MVNKLMGAYPEKVSPKLYAAVPKAVFAGIAAGIVVNGGASLQGSETVDQYIATEWVLMFNQGLVKSAPPAWVAALALGSEAK